jgi:hypothetical protein
VKTKNLCIRGTEEKFAHTITGKGRKVMEGKERKKKHGNGGFQE